MFVVKPIEIDDSILTSSIAEPDTGEVEWNPYLYYASCSGLSFEPKSASYDRNAQEWYFLDADTVRVVKTDRNFENVQVVVPATEIGGSPIGVAYSEFGVWIAWESGGQTTLSRHFFNGLQDRSFIATNNSAIDIDGGLDLVYTDKSELVLMHAETTIERIFQFYDVDGNIDTAKTFTVPGGSTPLNTFDSFSYSEAGGGTFFAGLKTQYFSFDRSGTEIAKAGISELDESIIPQASAFDGETVRFFYDVSGLIRSYKRDPATMLSLTWVVGDEVILTTTHRKYRATTNNNVSPDIGVNLSPATWVDIGPTNRYAMFDKIISKVSTDASPVSYTLSAPGAIDTIAGFNIDASTVNITMVDPIYGEVYNQDIEIIDNSGVLGWWELFTLPIINRRQFVATDLPFYPNADITVTFTTTGDDIFIGEVVHGIKRSLGVAQYGTSQNILNFNTLTRNSFGEIERTTGRKTADQFNFKIKILEPNSLLFSNTIKELNDTQCLWMGKGDNGDETIVLGYYRDVVKDWESPSLHGSILQIEGVI